MAANLKSSSGGIATLGKRLLKRHQPTLFNASPAPAPFTSRSGHASAYDKNLDDHVQPTVVPDDVIQPQSDKYWAPHPQTGVFGPVTDLNPSTAAGGEQATHDSSVMEEKAWFRPTNIEDLEKPHHH
ncbi:hypothetical protein PTKIN_Ptkin06aG0126000 [Pterospermum kingtungense]